MSDLVIVAVAALALGAPQLAQAQDWRTINSARQSAGESELRVDVEYAAGNLSVGAAPKGTLYRANLRYDADVFRPAVNYRTGRLRIEHEGAEVRGRNLKAGELNLLLAPDVPLDLHLSFGAAEANLDLGGLRVRSAGISTGASSTILNVSSPNDDRCSALTIKVGAAKFQALRLGNLNTARLDVEGGVGEVLLDFSGRWQGDMEADIELGLGSLTLRVPRGLGVRVVKDGLLASFDSQGLVKRGNVFYSEGFEAAQHKLSINLDAALGTIKVVWVD